MIKIFDRKTFTFDEKRFMEFFYPVNDTPFEGYSESIEAFENGNILKVIDIEVKKITGHPANSTQINSIMRNIGIKVTE
jgi:hypothetical protein